MCRCCIRGEGPCDKCTTNLNTLGDKKHIYFDNPNCTGHLVVDLISSCELFQSHHHIDTDISFVCLHCKTKNSTKKPFFSEGDHCCCDNSTTISKWSIPAEVELYFNDEICKGHKLCNLYSRCEGCAAPGEEFICLDCKQIGESSHYNRRHGDHCCCN
jgi:hypothetical protein